MKTTIDLPDAILHRAKITAAQRKTTLKELIIQGLDYATRTAPANEDQQRREKAARLIAALSRGRNTAPVGRLNRDEIYDRHKDRFEPA